MSARPIVRVEQVTVSNPQRCCGYLFKTRVRTSSCWPEQLDFLLLCVKFHFAFFVGLKIKMRELNQLVVVAMWPVWDLMIAQQQSEPEPLQLFLWLVWSCWLCGNSRRNQTGRNAGDTLVGGLDTFGSLPFINVTIANKHIDGFSPIFIRVSFVCVLYFSFPWHSSLNLERLVCTCLSPLEKERKREKLWFP